MIDVVRAGGLCVARVRCDGCGAAAFDAAPIDPSQLLFHARYLRLMAATHERWVRAALFGGGVAIFCERCWDAAEIREI
jgi:hypothetical protein